MVLRLINGEIGQLLKLYAASSRGFIRGRAEDAPEGRPFGGQKRC